MNRRAVRTSRRLLLLTCAVGLPCWAGTSANMVSTSRAGQVAHVVTVAELAASSCAGVAPTTLRHGSGRVDGTTGADLVIGSAGDDQLYGDGDDDCLRSGAGNDLLDGGAGYDVCVGDAGTQTYVNCEVTTGP